MKKVYLGLGSNLGDRTANIQQALKQLETSGVSILRQSSLYETEPMEVKNQPWFLNMVVEAETDLLPRTLLARVLRIEANLGRRRTVAKGPRVIDIDILLYGQAHIETANLTVPHPGLDERRFVLEPLQELLPDFVHPITGVTVLTMLVRLQSQGVRRIGRMELLGGSTA